MNCIYDMGDIGTINFFLAPRITWKLDLWYSYSVFRFSH
jgi:hypothetical protein